jgi:hypothetical protein
MKKLQLFVLLALIGSWSIKASSEKESCDPEVFFAGVTTSLIGAMTGTYGLGKLCLYKSKSNSYYTTKHRNFWKASNVLLKTSSALKVPCFWFSLITICGTLNNKSF